MKGCNHRSQHLSAHSIGLSVLDLGEVEKICCPEVDNDHSGHLNLPKISCELKQQNPEIRTCYKGCKGKRPRLKKHTMTEGQRTHIQSLCRAKMKRTQKMREEILSLHKQGFEVKEIAQKVNRGVETIYNRLRESGVHTPRGNSIRVQILQWLKDNPQAHELDIVAKFGCKRATAQTYRRDFRRGLV